MLKRAITYHDFDGNEVTEDFYFNLSKAELVDMELLKEGGLAGHLQEIVKRNNPKEILDTFKWLIGKSYGERSDDGKHFLKSDEIWESFQSTAAYSELYMLLVTDAKFSAEFVNGVIPQDLKDHLPKQMPTVPRAPDADIIGGVLANELVDEELMATRNTPPNEIKLDDTILRKTLEERGLPHEEIDKILGA